MDEQDILGFTVPHKLHDPLGICMGTEGHVLFVEEEEMGMITSASNGGKGGIWKRNTNNWEMSPNEMQPHKKGE